MNKLPKALLLLTAVQPRSAAMLAMYPLYDNSFFTRLRQQAETTVAFAKANETVELIGMPKKDEYDVTRTVPTRVRQFTLRTTSFHASPIFCQSTQNLTLARHPLTFDDILTHRPQDGSSRLHLHDMVTGLPIEEALDDHGVPVMIPYEELDAVMHSINIPGDNAEERWKNLLGARVVGGSMFVLPTWEDRVVYRVPENLMDGEDIEKAIHVRLKGESHTGVVSTRAVAYQRLRMHEDAFLSLR